MSPLCTCGLGESCAICQALPNFLSSLPLEQQKFIEQFPNLKAMFQGCVSGHVSEWPQVRAEVRKLLDLLVHPSAAFIAHVWENGLEETHWVQIWPAERCYSGTGQQGGFIFGTALALTKEEAVEGAKLALHNCLQARATREIGRVKKEDDCPPECWLCGKTCLSYPCAECGAPAEPEKPQVIKDLEAQFPNSCLLTPEREDYPTHGPNCTCDCCATRD